MRARERDRHLDSAEGRKKKETGGVGKMANSRVRFSKGWRQPCTKMANQRERKNERRKDAGRSAEE